MATELRLVMIGIHKGIADAVDLPVVASGVLGT
jgi:hypothetical protein